VLPRCRDVMGEEDLIEDEDQEGYRSMWELLQDPDRDTVWARSAADFETPDDFVNVLRVGLLGFVRRRHEGRHQRHVNHLNN